MLKIFFSVNHSGCAWWRARQPAAMINKLGFAECYVYSHEDTTRDNAEEIIKKADVIVSQSPSGLQSVALTTRYQEMGKVVVADYDDLVYSCSPFNPGYKTLGLKEVKVKQKDGTEIWIWKDGREGFSIKDNYFRYRAQIDLLGILDGLTTTNDLLAEKYLENMPEGSDEKISILPNSIDFDLFKPFPKKNTGKIRIGWTASSSHFNEIWMVADIMKRIEDEYGDKIIFVELGDVPELQTKLKNMEWHPFVDLSVYPLKFASLNLDIGICPLAQDEFNSYKSQLKWSEYSALGVSTVCTNLFPYEVVEEGRTGFLAKDENEFFEKLCLLIENENLRKEISNNAFEKNYQDFNLKKNAKLWVDAYEGSHRRVWVNRETALTQS